MLHIINLLKVEGLFIFGEDLIVYKLLCNNEYISTTFRFWMEKSLERYQVLYLKPLNFRQWPEAQANGANHIIEWHGAEAIT